jgi:hypothetical protein
MLTSINPLGERARGQRFANTVVWYVVGSTLGGAVLGMLGGLVGSPLPEGQWRVVVSGVVALVGALWDMRGNAPPSIHRQVNEDWLGRYRGWVYGLGFGAQLGFGLVTIVPSASIYSMVVLTVLSGSPMAGALIGGTFGLFRSSFIFAASTARDPSSLRTLMRRLQDLLPAARASVVTAQLLVVGVALWVVI